MARFKGRPELFGRKTKKQTEAPARKPLTPEERQQYRKDAYMAGYGDMALDWMDKEVSADHYGEGFTVEMPDGSERPFPPDEVDEEYSYYIDRDHDLVRTFAAGGGTEIWSGEKQEWFSFQVDLMHYGREITPEQAARIGGSECISQETDTTE